MIERIAHRCLAIMVALHHEPCDRIGKQLLERGLDVPPIGFHQPPSWLVEATLLSSDIASITVM
jgi:hypothetical protein